MANVTQLKHLEHLEEEMLNYGVDGCVASVNFLKELMKMLGKKSDASGFLQTKWDGAPSVICGKSPTTGMFFVGTKSVFNKTEPKTCYSDEQIDIWYQGDLATKLKYALKYFQELDIDGVIQGDLLYTDDTIDKEKVDGIDYYMFRPNTITYAAPVDSPLGKQIKQSKIGVVFHTHYTGDVLAEMQARAGAKIKSNSHVACIQNDTPINKVTLTEREITEFNRHIAKIERMCRICGPFLDDLVENFGNTGDKKFHISSYIKQFFNAEIRERRNVGNVDETIYSLVNFYDAKMQKELAKIKTPANRVKKANLVYKSENYLIDNVYKFKAMLALYKEFQIVKQKIIDKLDHLEEFKTFVLTENGYKITTPEGYVLHQDGNMIKLVNRLEFAYNNFTLQKQWR